MREDLIERLNDAWRRLYADGDEHGVCDMIAEAAAALEALRAERDLFRDETIELVRQNGEWQARLEAAREDAERLDWLAGDAVLTSGWREHGTWETPALLVNSTRETCTPRDFRAAIDQARGKGAA